MFCVGDVEPVALGTSSCTSTCTCVKEQSFDGEFDTWGFLSFSFSSSEDEDSSLLSKLLMLLLGILGIIVLFFDVFFQAIKVVQLESWKKISFVAIDVDCWSHTGTYHQKDFAETACLWLAGKKVTWNLEFHKRRDQNLMTCQGSELIFWWGPNSLSFIFENKNSPSSDPSKKGIRTPKESYFHGTTKNGVRKSEVLTR